jgi:hypothetical protein
VEPGASSRPILITLAPGISSALNLFRAPQTGAPQLVILNKRPLLPRVKDLKPGASSRPIRNFPLVKLLIQPLTR